MIHHFGKTTINMNWKKRAQFSGPAIGDIDDILGNIHQTKMYEEDAKQGTIRGRRPSEDSVPTVQTEPEYLLTQKREKDLENKETKISRYYSPHISEQVNHSVNSAIDSILKLSKAFKLGKAINELMENKNIIDKITLHSYKMLRAKLVSDVLSNINKKNEWADRETAIISNIRVKELLSVYENEEKNILGVFKEVVEEISFKTKKIAEYSAIFEMIVKEFLNSLKYNSLDYSES